MIIIRQFEKAAKRNYILSIALTGLVTICLLESLFLLIQPIFLFLAAAFAVIPASAFFIYKLWKNFKASIRVLPETVEIAAFGRRRFVLEAAEEYSKRPEEIDLARELNLELKNSPGLKNYSSQFTKAHQKRMTLYLLFLLIAMTGVILTGPQTARKVDTLTRFIQKDYQVRLPHYFLSGQNIPFDFSGLANEFDSMSLETEGYAIESTNGILNWPSSKVRAPTLPLVLRGTKYGWTKKLARAVLKEENRLVLDETTLTIVFPEGSGLKDEILSGLQDTEIWSGSLIKLKGACNKPLTKALLQPTGFDKVKISSNTFEAVLKPKTSSRYSLTLSSSEQDNWKSPPFMVRIKHNQKPSLRLVFPTGDITLNSVKWVVNSITEAEDDAGLSRLETIITVVNNDKALVGLSWKKSMTTGLQGSGFSRTELQYSSSALELLPGDSASLSIKAVDIFGFRSDAVLFKIYMPDFDDIQKIIDAERRSLDTSVSSVSNLLRSLEKAYQNDSLNAVEQRSRETAQKARDISSSVDALSSTLTGKDNDLTEITETMKEMKAISQELIEKAETLKTLSRWMEEQPMVPDTSPDQSIQDMKELLEKFRGLLKTLDYYKKTAELLSALDELKTIYQSLRKETDAAQFERKSSLYENALEQMAVLSRKDSMRIIDSLKSELSKISPASPQSFENSDRLMDELEKAVQDEASSKAASRMKEKIESAGRILEEIYAIVLIYQNIAGTMGTLQEAQKLQSIVEAVNSANSSLRWVRSELDKIMEGLLFQNNSGEALTQTLDILDQKVATIQEALRDRKFSIVIPESAIFQSLCGRFFMEMLYLDEALKKSASSSSEGGKPTQGGSLSLNDLMNMQGAVSQGLEKVLEKLGQDGAVTPEQKQLLDELAKLQSEIARNLDKLAGGQENGLISGGKELRGSMDELAQEMQSYNIRKETLSKSKKLEEKLLKAQKALQSKGISEDRKADQAKTYIISPPGHYMEQKEIKVDLTSLSNKALEEYYRKLLDRYRKTK